MLMMIVKIIE
ncbi:hypothetical protein Mgra_00004628 [Meloidogyne graminicola]|uniref:Uncharacterized protein n=1 Tax=Meloidogyne graminicola TaxID=189291 RepID=A0A8S9ZQK9_9BILA|nr:hypothetical protein Mgra_00004628 [Meloidogyne graminicola]